uniref:Uncharacterized protein n=1 Tax=Arundo donax TaxID=35708 RepID=A0A0A9TMB2_ARUDO
MCQGVSLQACQIASCIVELRFLVEEHLLI